MSWYKIKSKTERILKKIPLIYAIGHRYRLKRNEKKDRVLREALKLHGMEAIKDVQQAMEKTGLDFFFTYGTLLGMMRDAELISHDNDLDVSIIKKEGFRWETVDKAMASIGFLPSRSFSLQQNIVERTYTRNQLGVDFFLAQVEGEKMKSVFFYRTTAQTYDLRWEHSVAFLYDSPVETIEKHDFKGLKVHVPKNWEEILYGNYGPMWRVPDKNWNYWDAPNIKKSDLRGMRINHV